MNTGSFSSSNNVNKSFVLWTPTKSGFPTFACSYSISMTVDVYGHLVPGANRAAMDRLPTVEDSVKESLEEAPQKLTK